jgi:hypothetical protein
VVVTRNCPGRPSQSRGDVSVDTKVVDFEGKYSGLDHLRKSLFAKQTDLVVMLTAYVDDSGTGANDAIAVAAGYVATQHMWDRFQTRWQVLLRKYEIRQMHRSDLETFHGEFKTWDPAKRTEKAHAIIRNCTYSGIGLALVKSTMKK